ncbi:hypothetical protein ACFL2E_07755 [Thermodesulfobacteriota bacterium]
MRINIKAISSFALTLFFLLAFQGPATAATAITQHVTNISYHRATGNGTVSNPFYVNAYGVCWNTTGAPPTPLEDNNTNEGATSVAVDFSSEMSGLAPETTYFVRAYAREWWGGVISYGDVVQFTTTKPIPTVTTQPVTDIKSKSALGHGTVEDLGIPDPTQHGVCWNKDGTPTIDDKKSEEGEVHAAGPFTSEIKGLKSNRNYFVRAYATNDKGTGYGNEVSFSTSPSPSIVTTQAVTEIGINNATAHGTIEDVGAPNPNQHGFCWNTTGMPDLGDDKTEQGEVNETGSFSSVISALLPDMTYHVRAYATNTAGTSYGDDVTFRTAPIASAPIATLLDIPGKTTNATSYSIRVGGIGVVSYRYRLDTDSWSRERHINDSINFERYGEGRHTLSVVGKSDAGVWQAFDDSTTIAWDIDRTPPEVTLYNYPLGISDSSGAEIIVGGLDVVSYRYRIDGAEWSGISPVRNPIRLSLLSEGEHSLEVIGADYANNWQDETNAAHISWMNDTSVPTAVLSNVPNSVTNQITVNMKITYPASGIPIDAYAYTIDDGYHWWNQGANQAIELTGLREGNHSLCVNAFGDGLWQDGVDGMTSIDNATCIQWRVDVTPANPAVLSVRTNDMPAAFPTGIPGTTSAQLSWIWISEDELETIQRYRVWYSEEQLTEKELDNATELFCDVTPGIEGYEEVFTVSGLVSGSQYYFGVQSIDGAGNTSGLSNVVALVPEGQLPKITTLELTEGGMRTDNATARELTIDGDNFLETVSCNIVRFENESLVFDFVSKHGTAGKIFADIPMGSPPGKYRVRVINKNGVSSASSAMITITEAEVPVPVVIEIAPLVAEIGTPTVLTILGENFDQAGNAVNLLSSDGIQTPLASVIRQDSQTITAIVDVPEDFAEGQYHVQVINSDGRFNQVSAVKLELCSPLVLQDDAGAVTTTKIIRLGDGSIPATTTLLTDDRNETATAASNRSRIKFFIEPGSLFETGDINQTGWTDYTGPIRPPRQIPSNETVLNTLGAGSVTFSVGIDDFLRIKNGETMFVLIETTVPDSTGNPVVYYVSPEGDLSPAGVDGHWRDVAIRQGGTVLSTRYNMPEDGLTMYTIGLLLTSMSDYAIGSNLYGNSEGSLGNEYGFCFITALNTANMILMHGVIVFSAIALAVIYFKRRKR